jgi:hypothetical protein
LTLGASPLPVSGVGAVDDAGEAFKIEGDGFGGFTGAVEVGHISGDGGGVAGAGQAVGADFVDEERVLADAAGAAKSARPWMSEWDTLRNAPPS